MSEEKLKKLLSILAIFTIILLFVGGIFGIKDMKEKSIEDKKVEIQKYIDDTYVKVEELHKEFEILTKDIEKAAIRESYNIDAENDIAYEYSILPLNLIIGNEYEEVLYVFDRILDFGQSDLYSIQNNSNITVMYSDVVKQNIDIYQADNAETPEIFYVFNSKVYIYKIDTEGKLNEKYDEIMEENRKFLEARPNFEIEEPEEEVLDDIYLNENFEEWHEENLRKLQEQEEAWKQQENSETSTETNDEVNEQ